MNLQIKQAEQSDVSDIAQLYDTLTKYLEANINYPNWKNGVYPTVLEAQHFADINSLYIAKIDGETVASVVLTHEPEPPPVNTEWGVKATDDEVLVLHVFTVNPKYFGQGIAGKILNFATELAKSQNLKAIRLDVFETNAPAIKLYENNGFKYVDTIPLEIPDRESEWYKLYEKEL